MMYKETLKLPSKKIASVGEFALIREINEMIQKKQKKDGTVILGIGDDAAVIKTQAKNFLVATVDGMIEHIHFSRDTNDWYSIGWKSAAMNFSDLAAMGATPRWLLVQLSLTEDCSVSSVRQLYRGLSDCASMYKAQIIGGNMSRSYHECSVIVTALGECLPKKILKRTGARVGDRIILTGYPGLSAAGLKHLSGGSTNLSNAAVRRHLRPIPRVAEIQKLLKAGIGIHAAIDISDGLTADLGHICESSGVGAILDQTAIPLHPALRRLARQTGDDPYQMALSGGEEYELILIIPPKEWPKAQRTLPQLKAIGYITNQPGIVLRNTNSNLKIIQPKGYTHF